MSVSGGIAHDFNNLLSSMIGNLDVVLLDMDSTSESRDPLLEVKTAAQHAASLCRQLLAYSGKGSFVVGRLDMNQVITELRELLRVSVPRSAEFVSSGYSEEQITQSLDTVLPDAFLQKPYEYKTLEALLRRVLVSGKSKPK